MSGSLTRLRVLTCHCVNITVMTIRAVRHINHRPAADQSGFITDIGMEIGCYSPECSTAYRIDYTTTETKFDLGKLRKQATAKVNETHPRHPDVIVLKS